MIRAKPRRVAIATLTRSPEMKNPYYPLIKALYTSLKGPTITAILIIIILTGCQL
jgi:hypothetical protein